MDLTPLRPTASFLSSKVCIHRWISRSGTRLSAWIVACTFVLADGDPGWTAPPRFPLIQIVAFLRYSPHNLFLVLLHVKLPVNLDKLLVCYFAANWSGRPSATHPRTCQGLSSMMMFVDFALWPAFCSENWQSQSKLGLGARLELGVRKGDRWVIPPIQSAY